MNIDVIAFGIHPDDVEACCGGLLLNLTKANSQAAIIDLTLGKYSTNGTIKERQKEAESGRRVLGCKFRDNLEFDEQELHEHNHDQEKAIIDKIRDYQPQMVLLPYWEDRHPDHVNGSKLLKRAIYNSGLHKLHPGKPAFRPKWVLFYALHYELTPDIIVDISNVYQQKEKAILCHRSQFQRSNKNHRASYINGGDFLQFWKARARLYGYKIGVQYGEPYKMITPPGISNPFDLLVKDY